MPHVPCQAGLAVALATLACSAACGGPDLAALGARARTVSSFHVVARAYHADAGRGERATIDWSSPWERVELWRRDQRTKIARSSDGVPTRVMIVAQGDALHTERDPDGRVSGARFPVAAPGEALDIVGESWWLIEGADGYDHVRSGERGHLVASGAPWAADTMTAGLAWFEWRGPLDGGPLSSEDERLWVGVSRADGYPRVAVRRIRENDKDPNSPALDRIWRVDAFDVVDVSPTLFCVPREAAGVPWWDGYTRQQGPAPIGVYCP